MNEMACIMTVGPLTASRWEEAGCQGWLDWGAEVPRVTLMEQEQLPSEDLVCARHWVEPSLSSQ